MHRRDLMVLYTVLVGTALMLGWRLVSEWKRADLRYQTQSAPKSAPAPGQQPALPRAAPTPTADIIAKNIFSSERNSQAPQDAKSQPPPPMPVVFGTMNLGGSYEALMAESVQKPAFRRVKTGEKMGPYLVAEIADEKVVVEYQGQKTTLDVYQSANSVPRAQAAAPAPPTAPVVESIAAPQPSPATAQPSAAPAQPDSGTRVTVEGTRRRMEKQGPFGLQIWYEDIPK